MRDIVAGHRRRILLVFRFLDRPTRFWVYARHRSHGRRPPMATTLTRKIEALQTEVLRQRQLVQEQMLQIEKQQAVLGVQFRRIADIQAELDLVKATVRLAAPTFAAALLGHAHSTASSASRFVPFRDRLNENLSEHESRR